MAQHRFTIVGGGLVGLGSAYRLQEAYPDAQVTVLEKEPGVCRHQSGHNSGVLHCGLYYKPGSMKARMAVTGIRQMVAFCQEHNIPHEVCGKLVVATSEEEVERLKDLQTRGTQNGLEGLQWMERAEYREIEPYAGGIAALRVPQEGIADYPAVADTLVRLITARGGQVRTNAKVTALRQTAEGWVAETPAGAVESTMLVNCAGLHSDLVAMMSGQKREVRIVPFRGEYYKIRRERETLVRHLIYPVPDPKFPFLGVHYTRMIQGGVECGPNAVLAFCREGYRKTDFKAGEMWDALTFSGLWRFLGRYPRMCFDEMRRSFSKSLFCASLQRLVPEVRIEDLEEGGAGVRAQAMNPSGDLVQDFHFVHGPRALHVVNAPSPGATSSLAIGQEVTAMVVKSLG
ncbi:MAG: L-2-hydroxyglutarate oxidase [Bryobacterales bacterium]|nr:L-2-hydroxyglutarate oxidase [Bryobacterales bacterium]